MVPCVDLRSALVIGVWWVISIGEKRRVSVSISRWSGDGSRGASLLRGADAGEESRGGFQASRNERGRDGIEAVEMTRAAEFNRLA